MSFDELRIAVIHHWLLSMTGGEKVVEALCELFESPDLFSLVADTRALSDTLNRCKLSTSFVQNIPGAHKWHRYYTFLFPLAVELFDLRNYDVVISSDANTVKGVITRPETCHICYCHSPMRYAWSMFHEHLPEGWVRRGLMAMLMHYLRLWDHAASSRVDFFVANSETVRARIKKYYRREAALIYPPCDLQRFQVTSRVDDYYLCVGRLVEYKQTEIAVRAFNENGKLLLVVGDGPQKAFLKSIAGPHVEILGWVPEVDLPQLYERCRALIFPGEEDFGIAPVESQACGRPVIAYGRGGALETVVPGKTGLLFYEQTPGALNAAVSKLEARQDAFDPDTIRVNAERFSKERFQSEFSAFVRECLQQYPGALGRPGERA